MPADTRLLDDDQPALVRPLVREFAAAEASPAATEHEARAENRNSGG